MENASKALLMAAGMLIAVLIASIFALMFSTMSEYTKAYDERKQTEELQAFNGQFEKYVTSGATAQEVVTVINLAKSYNEKMGENITVEVEPKIDGLVNKEINFDALNLEECLNSFLKSRSQGEDGADSNKTKMIKYDVSINHDGNGRVEKITFKQDGFFD